VLRDLFHIPLLVRACTFLPLIGARKRTDSICCQNQIIFCQQSRRKNCHLRQPCGQAHILLNDHYRTHMGRPDIYIFIKWWQFWGQKCRANWWWISKNALSDCFLPCSALTVPWRRGQSGAVELQRLWLSQEKNNVLMWVVQNHRKSIYGTLNQISLGGDSTLHPVALSLSEGLPSCNKKVSNVR